MGDDRPTTSRRVTVTEAAWLLDTTVDALRKRVQRDTIPHERDEYGRVWILVDTDRTRQDTTGQRADTDQPQSDTTALISELRAHNATLRAQLESERQAHAEARRLLLSALEKIPPAIEAPTSRPRDDAESPSPSDDRESPVSFRVGPEREDTTEASGDREVTTERRWWEFWK